MKNFIIAVILCASSLPTLANTKSLYVGQETREIKALSQQEIVGYLNGKGLGYAKAAELNRYPGPSHVLELAKELNLTEKQMRRTQEIFDTMKAQASLLGKQFVAKEQELDQQFSEGTINEGSLKNILAAIGKLRSDIRHVHLSAHLEQRSLLTIHQINLYDQLRGYGKSHSSEHNHVH